MVYEILRPQRGGVSIWKINMYIESLKNGWSDRLKNRTGLRWNDISRYLCAAKFQGLTCGVSWKPKNTNSSGYANTTRLIKYIFKKWSNTLNSWNVWVLIGWTGSYAYVFKNYSQIFKGWSSICLKKDRNLKYTMNFLGFN